MASQDPHSWGDRPKLANLAELLEWLQRVVEPHLAVVEKDRCIVSNGANTGTRLTICPDASTLAKAAELLWDETSRACDWLAHRGYLDAPVMPPKTFDPDEARLRYRTVEQYLKRKLGSDGPPRKRKTRSWTQPDLNEAIAEYKAKRAGTYSEMVGRIERGDKGAKKAAKKMFGRNVIADALRANRTMVGKSPAWHAIADAMELPRKRTPGPAGPGKKIGLGIALEKQADATDGNVPDEAVRRETIRMVKANLKKTDAEPTIEKLERGDMSDDDARALVRELSKS